MHFLPIFALVSFLVVCSADAEVVDVYILAGQSNMAGQGRTNDLSTPDRHTQTNVLFWTRSGSWQNYAPVPGMLGSNGFGPEISLGRTIAQSRGRVAAIIKFAVGGTDLFQEWNPHLPNSLYYQMRAQVEMATAALRLQGMVPYIGGVFWMQGESDAESSRMASMYERTLRDFIFQLRKDLSNPELPVIIGRISNSQEWPYRSDVRNAQTVVGQTVVNCLTFSTDDLQLWPDNMHYNSTSIVVLGERFANQYLTLPDFNGPGELPRVLRAHTESLTNVVLTFSKPLADTAAASVNFSAGPDLQILSATLDASSLSQINLATSAQTPGSNYTIQVTNVLDRTDPPNEVPANSTADFVAPGPFGAFANVPQSAGFRLIYRLAIPVANPNWNVNGITYSYDYAAAGGVTFPFSRVAYYLELQPFDGPLRYVFASFDALTTNLGKIGVPAVVTAVTNHQNVANLDVRSNVGGVTSGFFPTGGNIEFWPRSYTPTRSRNLPNSSSTVYDWDDTPTGTDHSGYGSMQIHNHAVGQVLLAYNRWGATESLSDVGIGNNTESLHRDYTFMSNAGFYRIRRLEIYALPPPGLRIENMADRVKIAWPLAAERFSLQTALGLPAASWLPVTNSPVILQNEACVFLDNAHPVQLFRLFR